MIVDEVAAEPQDVPEAHVTMPALEGHVMLPPPAYCGMFNVVPFHVAAPEDPMVVSVMAAGNVLGYPVRPEMVE
jgi:hypothetical protein